MYTGQRLRIEAIFRKYDNYLSKLNSRKECGWI